MNVYNCIHVYKYIKICMFVGEPRRAHDHCRISRNVSCCHVRAKQWRQIAGILCNRVNHSGTHYNNPLQKLLQHHCNTVKHSKTQ